MLEEITNFIDTLSEALAKHGLLERPMNSDLILKLCHLEAIITPVHPDALDETLKLLLRHGRPFETDSTTLNRYRRGDGVYVFRVREAALVA